MYRDKYKHLYGVMKVFREDVPKVTLWCTTQRETAMVSSQQMMLGSLYT